MADPKPSPPLTRAGRLQVRLAAAACLLPLLLQLPPTLGIGIAAMAVLVLAASWRKPLPGGVRIVVLLGGMVAVVFNLPGVGRDTASALLALMIAIKPAETVSLRDGRSLIGFALFAPFATFLLDQAPTSLLLSLAAVMLAGRVGCALLRDGGVPVFAFPEDAMRAMAAKCRFAEWSRRGALVYKTFEVNKAAVAALLDEEAAAGRTSLIELKALEVFRHYGFPIVPFELATSADAAAKAAAAELAEMGVRDGGALFRDCLASPAAWLAARRG